MEKRERRRREERRGEVGEGRGRWGKEKGEGKYIRAFLIEARPPPGNITVNVLVTPSKALALSLM